MKIFSIFSILIISCMLKVTNGTLEEDLIEKYKDMQLKIYVSGFESVSLKNGESSVYIIKCGRKQIECDASTQYCDTAADQCMNCANLCSDVRTTSRQVKGACEKHCPVFLVNESRKQKVTTATLTQAVTDKSIPKVETQQSGDYSLTILYVTVIGVIILILLVLLLSLMIYVTYKISHKDKQRRFYPRNIHPTDHNLNTGGQKKTDDQKVYQTATTIDETKVKNMEDKVPMQPASSSFPVQHIPTSSNSSDTETVVKSPESQELENTTVTKYRKSTGTGFNTVTSNEDQLAPSSTEDVCETVAKIKSTSNDFQTNSSCGRNEQPIFIHGYESTDPLLSNESRSSRFSNTHNNV